MNARSRFLVGLLSATATAGFICRVNISTAGALMMKEYNLTQIDLGRLFSSFLLGYAIFQIPAGAVADKLGTRKVLSVSVWLWVLFTILIAVIGWNQFGVSVSAILTAFMIMRFLLGITAAPTYPAAAAGISRWVPASFHARANGIVIASVGLGSALAPILVSSIMVKWGWQVALIVSALPALVIAFVWRRVREPESIVSTEVTTEKTDFQRNGSLKSGSFILLTISYSLQGYVGYIFVSWFYLYLVQVRHFNLLTGAWMSSLSWILSIISIPLGGFISDYLIKGRLGLRWGGNVVPIAGMGLSGILISIGAHTSSAIVAAITLALATSLVLSVEGPFWGMMNRISGNRSGVGGGIMNTGCNLGGLISPILTPWIASYLGWEFALYIAAGLAFTGALLWLGIQAPIQISDVKPQEVIG